MLLQLWLVCVFAKMIHSTLAIRFTSFLSILDLWHCIQFLKRWFNTTSRCRRGVVSCRRAQFSMSSDAETFPVFEKKSLTYDSLRQWFPTSGSRRIVCGIANSSLNSLLKSRIFRTSYINFGTRKAEVLNSLIINTTAKANDVSCIVCFGRSIYYSYINILLHQQNRNTDRSLWSSHYLHHNSYLISPIQLKSTWL